MEVKMGRHKKRGRPKGSKNKRGRPRGIKNKRGRPKGSKNKGFFAKLFGNIF